MLRRWMLASFCFLAVSTAYADEPAAKKQEPPSLAVEAVAVPYRLTDTHHVMVRAKINGKGPFNFIVDTGCPVFIVSEEVGKQLGLSPDKKGWTLLDKVEIEGGLKQEKIKCRVETPFQIKGMNTVGLPGVELHGMLGYTVIAKYKLQFDFKHDQMLWTPLDFQPPPPAPLGSKADLSNLESMAGMMKLFSALTGIKPGQPPVQRGFFGFEIADKDGKVIVERVLPKSPAAEAGLKAGDRIDAVGEAEIESSADLLSRAAKLLPGKSFPLRITRGSEVLQLKLIAGNGL